jgi:CRP/FNR family transcriptional regulator, cyclic AMP receptor protein
MVDLEARIGTNEARPALRRTGLRNFLSDQHLRELERFCRPVSRRAGTTLFRQDEPADTIFIALEGTVELRARPPGRRVYRTVEVVGEGCTFGDETLFGQERYLVSARVLEQARLLILPKPSFQRLSETHPGVATGLLQCSGSCLLQTLRRSAILTQSPADVGLKLLLQELAADGGARNGHSAPIHITHAQLAGVLHLSRETVSRMLGQMAEQGTVELGRGVIRVRLSDRR